MSRETRVETALDLLGKDNALTYGTFITVERFEQVFGFARDTQEFNWLVSNVRHALYERGVYLSGEGLAQTGGYSILPARENFWVAKLAMARAERDLAGKETLLINTKTEGFNQLQAARHESTLRLLSLRLSALRKTREHNEKVSRRRKQIVGEPDQDEE